MDFPTVKLQRTKQILEKSSEALPYFKYEQIIIRQGNEARFKWMETTMWKRKWTAHTRLIVAYIIGVHVEKETVGTR